MALGILALVVPVVGVGLTALHGPKLETAAIEQLTAGVDQKRKHVADWLKERDSLAATLATDDTLAVRVQSLVVSGDEGQRLGIRDSLSAISRAYGFHSFSVIDPAGNAVAVIGDVFQAGSRSGASAATAVATRQVLRAPLHFDAGGNARIDWYAPLVVMTAGSTRVAGLVRLQARADLTLYPLLRAWPVTDTQVEVLLLGPAADGIELFGPAAAVSGSATDLDTDTTIAAALATGADHRGVEMLAAFAPVDGIDWRLLARVERSQVMAPLSLLISWVSALSVLALAAVAATMIALWRQQERMRRLQERAQALEKDRLLARFFELPFVGMAITSPQSKRWLRCNDRLCEILGYDREELLTRSWLELTHPDDTALHVDEFECVLREVIRGRLARLREEAVPVPSVELRIRRLDGRTVEVESAASP